MSRLFRNEKGFTMIEMMVVLIIIAVLIGGGIKFYTGYISKAKITKAKSDITSIQAALDSYYVENNAYPATATLTTNAGLSLDFVNTTDAGKTYVYATVGNGYKVYTRVPVDGTNYVIGVGTDGRSDTPVTTDNVENWNPS